VIPMSVFREMDSTDGKQQQIRNTEFTVLFTRSEQRENVMKEIGKIKHGP
jgi:hypothetical protein